MDRGDLVEVLREACASEPGVEAAWLFGSCARGDANPGSDVDVAVLARGDLALTDELALRRRLADAAGLADIDLVLLRGASPLLRREATTGLRVFAHDDGRADAYERLTALEYFDTHHFRRVQRALLRENMEAIRRGAAP